MTSRVIVTMALSVLVGLASQSRSTATETPPRKAAVGKENCVWRLGGDNSPAETVDAEFKDIKAKEHVCVVPANWRSATAFDVPKILAVDAGSGCVKLKIEFNLEKGVYCFVRRLLEPEKPVCCEVYFDGRELDVWYTGASYFEEGKLLCRIQESRHPFICTESGRHAITLSMDRSMNTGRQVRVDSLALVPYVVQPCPHSLNTELPGRVCLDAWGWTASVSYQRRGKGPLAQPKHVASDDSYLSFRGDGDTVENLEYFQRRVIDESYKRGANFVQFYPFVELWATEWGRGYPGWEDDQVLKLIRYAHEHDMILDDHHNFGHETENAKDKIAAELDCLRKKAKYCFDMLGRPWKETLDGFESEGVRAVDVPEAMIKMYEVLWEHNPGCYMNECGTKWGTWRGRPWTRNSPYQRVKGPNFIQTTMSAHAYGVPGLLPLPKSGHDDKLPISPYPNHAELNNEYGKKFLGYQADARTFTTSAYGGGTYPDWIIKQANDFLRPRYKNPQDPYESCIWWLGEPENICPDWVKDYVYAVSQDPIKCAVTANLKTQGVGGTIQSQVEEAKKKMIAAGRNAEIPDNLFWKARGRTRFSWNTQFIQNNYLRICLDPNKQGGTLVCDMERAAHYDSNSLSVVLTDSFLTTEGRAKTDVLQKKFDVAEPGGYLSVLKSSMKLDIDGTRLTENRRYTMLGDTPYIRATIERNAEKTVPEVKLLLGSEGYDLLLVGGARYDKNAAFDKPGLPRVLRLQDSSGLKPDMVIAVLKQGRVSRMAWEPGGRLAFTSANVDKETIELAIIVPSGLYDEHQVEELVDSFSEQGTMLTLVNNSASVRNTRGIPLVKVVEIANPVAKPYLVKEFGWWMFRGAQRSLLGGRQHDYLKLYLSPSGEARIQVYGFIEGIVKPGWGCQYMLAIKDVARKKRNMKCVAKVMSVTPYLFAPRLEFKENVQQVTLNGKPWHYFDGNLVFLPNKPGLYEVEAAANGGAQSPRLVRTAALVESTGWNGSVFSFKAALPIWSKKLPVGLQFTALIRLPENWKIEKISGGQVIREYPHGKIVRFSTGEVRVFVKQ